MKWNAIISRSQYEKTLQREKEISHGLHGLPEEDELMLLRILIKDYEERQLEMQPAGFQITKPLTSSGYPKFLNISRGISGNEHTIGIEPMAL